MCILKDNVIIDRNLIAFYAQTTFLDNLLNFCNFCDKEYILNLQFLKVFKDFNKDIQDRTRLYYRKIKISSLTHLLIAHL